LNLSDHTTKDLLRMALTGADDELDDIAPLAMKAVAEELDVVYEALKAEGAADFDFTKVINGIAIRAEVAAELARRELAAAKQSGTHRMAEKAGLQ
jgi:hypothetical protein